MVKLTKVGYSLWLNLDKPHKVVRFIKNFPGHSGEYPEYLYEKAVHKSRNTYANVGGGWPLTKLILIGGYCFGVSGRNYSMSYVKKKRKSMRDSRARRREGGKRATA